jgi:hypothetical protein
MRNSGHNRLKEIIGAKLEAIGSAENTYIGVEPKGLFSTTSVSLLFDRGRLEIENPFTVLLGGTCIPSGSEAVTDTLNGLVGSKVVDAYLSSEEIGLDFEGDKSIRVSLRDEDWSGPEAGQYVPNEGTIIAFD